MHLNLWIASAECSATDSLTTCRRVSVCYNKPAGIKIPKTLVHSLEADARQPQRVLGCSGPAGLARNHCGPPPARLAPKIPRGLAITKPCCMGANKLHQNGTPTSSTLSLNADVDVTLNARSPRLGGTKHAALNSSWLLRHLFLLLIAIADSRKNYTCIICASVAASEALTVSTTANQTFLLR